MLNAKWSKGVGREKGEKYSRESLPHLKVTSPLFWVGPWKDDTMFCGHRGNLRQEEGWVPHFSRMGMDVTRWCRRVRIVESSICVRGCATCGYEGLRKGFGSIFGFCICGGPRTNALWVPRGDLPSLIQGKPPWASSLLWRFLPASSLLVWIVCCMNLSWTKRSLF